MKKINQTALAIAVLCAAAQANAEVTFYENPGFQGRSFSTEKKINDFARFGFNDRASSVTVTRERWEVCQDENFRGQCVVLRPGKYPTLAAMGLNDRISSVRAIKSKQRIEEWRYAPTPIPAQITFYENESFGGSSFTTDTLVENFRNKGFNDRVSSVTVVGPDQWEACEDERFSGRCAVLRPGQYPSLRGTGLNDRISSVRNTSVKTPVTTPPSGSAQVTFYENDNFSGRSFSTDKFIDNLTTYGFNDRASSAVVIGDSRWEVCDDSRFNGRCRVLRQGQYPSLTAMGLNDRISSVRQISRDARIDDRRYAPAPVAMPDDRQHQNERLYEADVTSVRAVVGTPEKRCWVEREQVHPGCRSRCPVGRHSGPPSGRRNRQRHCNRRRRDCRGRPWLTRRWQPQHPTWRDPRRTAMRRNAHTGPYRVLGCHLHLQRSGPPHSNDNATRPHDYRQRAGRAA
jgi:hypothetical protein